MKFFFNEVDADLNILQFVAAVCGGIGVVALPLLLKVVLAWMV